MTRVQDTLNIPEMPMGGIMGGMPTAAPAAVAGGAAPEGDAEPEEVRSTLIVRCDTSSVPAVQRHRGSRSLSIFLRNFYILIPRLTTNASMPERSKGLDSSSSIFGFASSNLVGCRFLLCSFLIHVLFMPARC